MKDFYGPFEGVNSGLAGLGDCESLFIYLKTRTMNAETYLVRHFLGAQQALGEGDLDNAYRPPGTGNPADGLTIVRSDAAPLSRLLESSCFSPGSYDPLWGWLGRSGRPMTRGGINLACAYPGANGPELKARWLGRDAKSRCIPPL